MPFVIQYENGNYMSARSARLVRHSKGNPNLAQARVFKRRCDAVNAGGSDKTIKEVRVVLVERAS